MRKRLLILAVAALTIVLVILIGLSIHLQVVGNSEPEYTGSVRIPGLQEGVAVRFDAFRIPHIQAANEKDLYTAAGYIVASERMWQMELRRLLGRGKLAEIVGREVLDMDRLMRVVGFSRLAGQLKDSLSEHTLESYRAYTRGINAYLEQHRDNLPLEYRFIGYTPESWKVEDTIMLTRLFAWELNIAWHLDIVLGALIDRLGAPRAREVFPVYPDTRPYIIPPGEGEMAGGLLPALTTDETIRKMFGGFGTHMGSNSWVISGERSESGKPILANDPHLLLVQPCRWYEMHLQSPGMNVSGVTLPGMPGVVIGHNDSIAWGLTNVMADDADFFVERVDPENPFRYRYNGQWREMDHRKEIIAIKDAPDDTLIVRETHHGPVVSDVHPAAGVSGKVYAMQWTGFEMSDEFDAIYRVNTASNWEEFSEGVNRFHVPGQNFMYADRRGNIGYRPAVKIPKRGRGSGNMPVPGHVDIYEWTEFILPGDLPYLFNPEEGYIATANNKVVRDDMFQYHISNLYEPPSRIERIRTLIESKRLHNTEDFMKYQLDVVSPHAKRVKRYFIRAMQGKQIDEQYLAHALQALKNWDGNMGENSFAASVFSVAFQKLIHHLYEDEMGDTLTHHFLKLANASIRNVSWMLDRPLNSWWDKVDTQVYETRDDILQRSLYEAVQWLRNHYGRSMVSWQWGKLHTLNIRHPFGEGNVLIDRLYGLSLGPFNIGGSGTTVNAGVYNYQEPYSMLLGPSMRLITDMSDFDRSRGILYSGQSGHPGSRHYDDQTPLWRTGEYRNRPFTDEAIQEGTESILSLLPIE